MISDSQTGLGGARFVAPLVLALLAGLSTSAHAQEPRSQPLLVVVSLQPWASLTSSIAGDLAEVVTLLPPGASPHGFDPLPSQAVSLARADLVVTNGGLDGWLLRLIEATATGARRLTIIEVIEFNAIEDDEHTGDSGQDDHGVNPHVWLDPVLASEAVGPIADALAELDPEHADTFQANAAALRVTLSRLDDELRLTLAPIAGMGIVPFHDAWVYFAGRYGLEIVATLETFPGREPSAAYLAATVAQIRSAGVRVIFTERQLNGRTALVVAESADVEVLVLDPIGGFPGPEDYVDLLRRNAQTILEGLRVE